MVIGAIESLSCAPAHKNSRIIIVSKQVTSRIPQKNKLRTRIAFTLPLSFLLSTNPAIPAEIRSGHDNCNVTLMPIPGRRRLGRCELVFQVISHKKDH